MTGDEGGPPIDDWNRLLDGRVAVVTGGGWLFSPREGRFVNRSRNL